MNEKDLKFLERRRALQPALLAASLLCFLAAFAWSAVVTSKFGDFIQLAAPDESFQFWQQLETTTELENKLKRFVISGLHAERSLATSLGGWISLSGFLVFALLGTWLLRAFFVHRRYLKIFTTVNRTEFGGTS